MAQDVEPFDYQKTNNMDEHKQIVDKVNEIVNVINEANLDGIPQLQSDVSTLKNDVANLESDVGQNTSDISRVDGDIGTLKSDVTGIKSSVGQNTSDIAGLDDDVDSLTTKVTTIESDISSLKAKDSEMANDIDTNENAITTLNGKVIKSVSATVPAEGKLRTTITLEDNSTFATDDTILGLIATGGVQIISTTTARAFKLRFTLTDGTFWDTNEFVIPEGGGTDVTVTSVNIIAGSTANTFKISIGLSDGSPIESNDYPFPTVPIASTATAGIVKVGSGLQITGDGTLSATPNSVPIATTSTAGIVKVGSGLQITGDGTLSATPSSVPVATANTAGIVKIGANINVTTDGTISVTFPTPPDLSPYLTKSEASTTYVTQTVANSTYETKANATTTYATKANLSELTGQMMNTPSNVIGMSSTSASGLMSNNDKSKLDGIANNANNYVLPIGGSAIGGVKNGGNVTIETDGTMNAEKSSLNYKSKSYTPSQFKTEISTLNRPIIISCTINASSKNIVYMGMMQPNISSYISNGVGYDYSYNPPKIVKSIDISNSGWQVIYADDITANISVTLFGAMLIY